MDIPELARVIDAAFGDTETSEFTQELREWEGYVPELTFVAEDGGAVVRAALAAADERGEPLVLVEGVPSYYPQFGFQPALSLGLLRPDERIPEAAWMAAPLAAYDPAVRGRVVYPAFFPPPPGA